MPFKYCPACLTTLDAAADDTHCNLCKTEISKSGLIANRMRMQQELEFQLKESTRLLSEREIHRKKLEDELIRLRDESVRLKEKYRGYLTTPDAYTAEVANLTEQIGYKQRQIEEVQEKLRLAGSLEERFNKRNKLALEIATLRETLERENIKREQRRSDLGSRISELVVTLLHKDIKAEEVFEKAKKFEFDFGKEWMAVDGEVKFSASSQVILKNSFLFSLFLLSLADKEVRWPKFILIDNIEDKGMTPPRSANFQKLIVEHSMASKVPHQIIFTTSMIASDLENSVYCVGPHYYPEPGKKTLAIG